MAVTQGTQYSIELSFNNREEHFHLPVLPESIEVGEKGRGNTYDIAGEGRGIEESRPGEINVIKSPGLREFSFSSFFPAQWYPFVRVKQEFLKSPFEYIDLIRKWWATKHPIRFIYAGSKYESVKSTGPIKSLLDYDLNVPVSIEKFDWKEVGGSPGDIEYSISLKEYNFYRARRISSFTDAAGQTVLRQQPKPRPDERIRPETYTLKTGDTLIKVALLELGNSGRYREIQQLNGITDSETRRLQVGRVLKLPQN